MPASTPILSADLSTEKLDRCGYLLTLKEASDAEPWRAELKALLTEFQAHYAGRAADIPIRAAGALYYIDLGKRENQKTVSHKRRCFDALKKAIGIEKLVEALTLTFKLIDAHIPADKQGTFVTQARTGSRDISAVPIAPKAA